MPRPALLALALLVALASPTAATAVTQGAAGVHVAYDDHGTPTPGDDVAGLEAGQEHLGVGLRSPGMPFGDGPTPTAALRADLRGLEAQHPAFHLVRAANGQLVEPLGLPAQLYVGPDGVDVGYAIAVAGRSDERRAGEAPLEWPGETYYGLPLVTDEDTIAIQPSIVRSTDRAADAVDGVSLYSCGAVDAFVHEQETPAGSVDPAQAGFGVPCISMAGPLQRAAPNVVVHTETPVVDVTLNARPGQPAGEGAPGAAPAAGDGAGLPGSNLPSGLGDRLSPEGAAPLGGDPLRAPSPGGALREASAAPADAPAPPGDATTALGLALLAGLGVALLAVPLYRRIVAGRVLRHEVRERIVALVRANPGLHESGVAHALGISHTLAQYHIRMLCEFGMLEMRRFGGRKCLFEPGSMGRAEKTLLLAERGRGAQVLDLVANQPGIAQRELARALAIRESSVKWHLDRLAEQGVVLVERGPDGKRVRLAPETEKARAANLLVAVPASAPEPREPAGPPAPADPHAPSPLRAEA